MFNDLFVNNLGELNDNYLACFTGYHIRNRE